MSDIKYIKTIENGKGKKLDVYANEPKLNDTQIHMLANVLNEAISKYYEDPKNVAKFNNWKKELNKSCEEVKIFIDSQIKKNPNFTINSTIIENEFKWSYNKANQILARLEESKIIKKIDGPTSHYIIVKNEG